MLHARFSLAALALALVACEGGTTSSFEIELANSGAEGAGAAVCDASASLPAGTDCLSLTMCERTTPGGACTPIAVTSPDGDHDNPPTELRIATASGRLAFDAMLQPGRSYDLEIRVYQGSRPYARGKVSGYTVGREPLRIRLEPWGTWLCAASSTRETAPAPRALHQAVALANGDVLLIGGVSGETVGPSALDAGARLVRTVEVYDTYESRFYPVSISDTDMNAGFGAVLHRARYLGVDADGRHRIRVVGGFTSTEVAVRFDASQGQTPIGMPIMPAGRAIPRDSVDIIYDAATRSATVVSAETGSVPVAGLDAVSEPDAAGELVVALGFLDSGGTAPRPRPGTSRTWYALPRSAAMVRSAEMLTPRLGATVSRVPGSSVVLAWGGNVTLGDAAMVQALAGEQLGTPSLAVAGGAAGFPESTVLHTATTLPDAILLAGGLRVQVEGGATPAVGASAPSQGLTIVRGGAGSMLSATPVTGGAAWTPTILHTATAVDLPGGAVVLTGGAIRSGTPTASLYSVSAAGIVRGDGTGNYTYTALPGLMVPRWGHAAAPLPDGRILVTGGFERVDMGRLRHVSTPEILILTERPADISACGAADEPDAGAARDASTAPSDAGVPMMDASAADDAATPDAGL